LIIAVLENVTGKNKDYGFELMKYLTPCLQNRFL
jgi:hypothetical protein